MKTKMQRLQYLVGIVFSFDVIAQVGSQFNPNESWTQEPYYGSRGTLFADVTGDGKADAIAINDGKVTVRRSDGSKFTGNESWTQVPYYGSRGTFFADVTGDRYVDAIAVNDRVTIRRSRGYGFAATETWTQEVYFGSRGTFFADVTGDGKVDAIVVNDDKVTMRRSDGSKFTGNESWTQEPYYGSRGTFFADVTGDGKADAIVVNDDKVTMRRSDGSKFTGNESWTQVPYYGSRGTFFADVTGDGKADAIAVNDDKVTVRRSDGSKFTGNESWTQVPYYGSRGTFFADVTGDGKADAIAVNDDKVTVRRSDSDLIVLTINAMGTGNFPQRNPLDIFPGGEWQTRVDRLANLIRGSGTRPDIISMTEFDGWRACTIPPSVSGDYDFVDRLIWRLKSLIGVTYRIAYMVGKVGAFGPLDRCQLYGGDIVLYNPNNLVNQAPQGPQHAHDEKLFGTHLRRSLPLCNRGTSIMPLDQLIDGPPQTDKCGRATPSGPAWVIMIEGTAKKDGKHYELISASLARFAYVHDPNVSFDVYTVHPYADLVFADAQSQQIAEFFNEMSAPPHRTTPRYYPPLVVGDFNNLAGPEEGEPEWPPGVNSIFVLKNDPSSPEDNGDVIAIKMGQTDKFPAVHTLEPVQKLRFPPGNVCSPYEPQAFSDHCALLVSFTKDGIPIPPPPEQSPPQPSPHEQCLTDCKAERDACMAEVGSPGGPRPQQCIAEFNRCRANWPP